MTASALTLVEPAFHHAPKYSVTLGPEVADLNHLAGFPPDPEQELVLNDLFAIDDANGKCAASEVDILCCRQNLKTGVLKMATLGWMYLLELDLIVWTAHEFFAAREAYREIKGLIQSTPSLDRRVARWSDSHGDEGIELHSGTRLLFKARSKNAGRSLSADRVVLDEGFALRPMDMGALIPVLSARRDPQYIIASSACRPESDVLRDAVARGRAGTDPSQAYAEWCAPPPEEACADGEKCDHARSRAGCGCDNEEYRQQANPAKGRRIDPATIQNERNKLPPNEFGRERMGWHDAPAANEGTTPFDLEKFGKLAVKKRVALSAPLALGFEVHPGGESASIAIWMRHGGLGYGELVEDREGTDWLVARLVELARKYKACTTVMNPAGPAGAYRQELLAEETGFVECAPKEKPAAGKQRLTLITAGEYGQACGSLVDDTRNGRWRYFFDQAPLIDAVEGVRTKPLLDAYKWSWKDSVVNIAPLNALTLAKHGFAAFGQAATAPFALWGR